MRAHRQSVAEWRGKPPERARQLSRRVSLVPAPLALRSAMTPFSNCRLPHPTESPGKTKKWNSRVSEKPSSFYPDGPDTASCGNCLSQTGTKARALDCSGPAITVTGSSLRRSTMPQCRTSVLRAPATSMYKLHCSVQCHPTRTGGETWIGARAIPPYTNCMALPTTRESSNNQITCG